ncbi:hypothetical protein MaudCBS49596_004316 [Microsporum audouinii]
MSCLVFTVIAYIVLGKESVSQPRSSLESIRSAESSPVGPTKPRISRNCNKWHTVEEGDTCSRVERAHGISHNQFLEWNPLVPKDCSRDFWYGYSYCVGVGRNPVTTTTPAETSMGRKTLSKATSPTTYSIRNPVTSHKLTFSPVETAWPPKRTQPGQPSHCNKWYLVRAGDTCRTICTLHGSTMTLEEL